MQFLIATPSSPSRTLEGLTVPIKGPQPASSIASRTTEMQGHRHVCRASRGGPRTRQEQLTQTLIVCCVCTCSCCSEHWRGQGPLGSPFATPSSSVVHTLLAPCRHFAMHYRKEQRSRNVCLLLLLHIKKHNYSQTVVIQLDSSRVHWQFCVHYRWCETGLAQVFLPNHFLKITLQIWFIDERCPRHIF